MDGYARTYEAWQTDPEAWWAEAAEGVAWDKRWDRVFDASLGAFGQWFAGARLNTSFNCLDRHVAAGRGEQPALIWDSPMTGRIETFTYARLLERTAKLAGALAGLGVARGDRVVIYLPMVPEAAIAMLACARLGAIHSVVFGGFAASELAARIADARPKVIVSASCGLEPGRVVQYKPLLDAAIAMSPHKPAACLILQREQSPAAMIAGRDHDYAELEAAGTPHPPVSVAATDPLYILYTSGTTGRPERRGTRQWRARGRAVELDAHGLRRRRGRRVLGGLRRRLGGRAQLHRLRAAAARLHHGHVRGQARRHARRRRVLAGVRAAQGARAVHRPHGVARDQAAGSRRRAAAALRPVAAGGAVSRGRALRPADGELGGLGAGQARRRSLVADRDRLDDHGGLPRSRPVSRSSPAPAVGPPPATRWPCWTTRALRRRRDRPAISASSCRCRPAARRPCGRTMRATAPPISATSPAGTAPATRARSTRTATCG